MTGGASGSGGRSYSYMSAPNVRTLTPRQEAARSVAEAADAEKHRLNHIKLTEELQNALVRATAAVADYDAINAADGAIGTVLESVETAAAPPHTEADRVISRLLRSVERAGVIATETLIAVGHARQSAEALVAVCERRVAESLAEFSRKFSDTRHANLLD